MNDNERSLNEQEDPDLAEAFAQLRRLQPSISARLANRAAVAAELRAIEAADVLRERHWWRRSISVPMPVAAGLLALLAITAPVSAATWLSRARTDAANAVDADVQSKIALERAPSPRDSLNREDAGVASQFSVTETYLCGVGRVSSSSQYSHANRYSHVESRP